MRTESAPETSENFHPLAQLSAREHFIKFRRRESFNTSKYQFCFLLPCTVVIAGQFTADKHLYILIYIYIYKRGPGNSVGIATD